MKRVKILSVLLFILLTSACQANVQLYVDENLNIEEVIRVSVEREFMDPYYSDTDEIKKYYEDFLNQYDTDYTLDVKYKDNQVVGTLKRKFNLLTDLGLESLWIERIEQEGDSYQLIFSSQVQDLFRSDTEMEMEDELLLEALKIDIQFENKLVSSNATEINSKTNTYTWIIDKNNFNQNIEFSLTNEKRYDIIIAKFIGKYAGVFIGVLVLAVISILSILLVRKIKHENEI